MLEREEREKVRKIVKNFAFHFPTDNLTLFFFCTNTSACEGKCTNTKTIEIWRNFHLLGCVCAFPWIDNSERVGNVFIELLFPLVVAFSDFILFGHFSYRAQLRIKLRLIWWIIACEHCNHHQFVFATFLFVIFLRMKKYSNFKNFFLIIKNFSKIA